MREGDASTGADLAALSILRSDQKCRKTPCNKAAAFEGIVVGVEIEVGALALWLRLQKLARFSSAFIVSSGLGWVRPSTALYSRGGDPVYEDADALM